MSGIAPFHPCTLTTRGSSTDSEVVSIDVGVKIDAISWSPCHEFVLLALSNGQGQLVHLPTKVPLPPFAIVNYDKKHEGKPESYFNQHFPNAFVGCWVEETNIENTFMMLFLSVQGVVSVVYIRTQAIVLFAPEVYISVPSISIKTLRNILTAH